MRRPAPPREIPPPLELLCLRKLWALEEATVREVQKAVSEERPLAYTTVLTLLVRLEKRGAAKRRKLGRTFVYSAANTREQLRDTAVRELITTWFDGSGEQLRDYCGIKQQPEKSAQQAKSI